LIQNTGRPIKRTRRATNTAFRRLPLGSLRVFVAVAEALSFTRAAHALGITAGAVSMQVRSLEEYLQTPLFLRRGRVLQLTAEGARLLPRVRDGLQQLELAIDEARIDRRSGPLMLSTLSSFLQQWLLPRLPQFTQKHPDIDLRVHTSALLVDFLRSDVQAAIRFGTGNWPQLHVEKILDEWLLAVCTKELLDRHGVIRDRDDLKRYPLLHAKTEPWSVWPKVTLSADEWAPRGASFDDSVSVIRAAEAGHGVALGRWSLVANEVALRRLVIASPVIVPAPRAYFFVCPPAYVSLEKVALFRAWVVRQAREAPLPRARP
jgi:LysR family glycine cleavage system transcriptional activator